jgi:isoquinoline 1-oxidoreductase subunit alpha
MVKLHVNGQWHELPDLAPDTPLLWILRDHLQLTGTRYGCGKGLCGSCTIHLNGKPARACVLTLSAVTEQAIVTIEGLQGDVAEALRDAWAENAVPQCGYCQTGQLMSAAELLERNPQPTDTEIEEAMVGNLCRCGTYTRIRAAIHMAAGGQQ